MRYDGRPLEVIGREIHDKVLSCVNQIQAKQIQEQKNLQDAIEVLRNTPTNDASENATLQNARKAVRDINGRILRLEKQMQDYITIQDIDINTYYPCGLIVPFSTVIVGNSKTGRQVYRIYPGNISGIEFGVLSLEAALTQKLIGKSKGDIFVFNNKTYTVEDIY